MIYQKKPYIMFIPDDNEPNKEKIYSEGYVDIINGLSNGSIYLKYKHVIDSNIYINSDFRKVVIKKIRIITKSIFSLSI